ncbi:MAG: DUF3649 domain-containing protein [Gammaproteobacteria bacterium]|nr:DUF3649 domain-containing protein [Gammaproteobacteria bacterium]
MQKESFAICSRAFAAIIGGYVLSNLLSIVLSYLLASPNGSGVITGMLVSYLIYAAIVMWVYSVASLRQVWRSIILVSVVCASVVYLFMPEIT